MISDQNPQPLEGFRVWGLQLRTLNPSGGLGFRVSGLGLGFRVSGLGLGFRVSGLGLGVRVSFGFRFRG